MGPLVGKAADAFGKLRVFFVGTALTIVMVLIYTHLSASTLIVVTVINVVLFIGIFSRMIPFQALMSQVPAPTQRGSFNAINASISQLAGGLASLVAGHIVQQGADGKHPSLRHRRLRRGRDVVDGLRPAVAHSARDRGARGGDGSLTTAACPGSWRKTA